MPFYLIVATSILMRKQWNQRMLVTCASLRGSESTISRFTFKKKHFFFLIALGLTQFLGNYNRSQLQ